MCCQLCPNQYNQTGIFTKLLSNKLSNQMVGQRINIFPGASLSQSDRLRDDLLPVPVGFRQCMPANIDILAFLLISGFVVFAIDTPLKPTRSMSSAYAWAKKALNRFLKLIRHTGMVNMRHIGIADPGAGIRLCQKELRTIDCHFFLWKRPPSTRPVCSSLAPILTALPDTALTSRRVIFLISHPDSRIEVRSIFSVGSLNAKRLFDSS